MMRPVVVPRRFAAAVTVAGLVALMLAFQTPAFAQDELDLSAAVLPEELDWQATKEQTLVEPPYGIPAVEIGVTIHGTMPVGAECSAEDCVYASSIDLWPQSPYGDLPVVQWQANGTVWSLPGTGNHLSASYPDGSVCVYERTETWTLVVTDAVFDGERLVATALEGTFRRTDALEPSISAVGIANGSCPPYQAADLWAVVATAEVVAAAVPSSTVSGLPVATASPPGSVPVETPAVSSDDGELSAWTAAMLVAIGLVLMGGGWVLLSRTRRLGPMGPEPEDEPGVEPSRPRRATGDPGPIPPSTPTPPDHRIEEECPHELDVRSPHPVFIDMGQIERLETGVLEELYGLATKAEQVVRFWGRTNTVVESMQAWAGQDRLRQLEIERRFRGEENSPPIEDFDISEAVTGYRMGLLRVEGDGQPSPSAGHQDTLRDRLTVRAMLHGAGPPDYSRTVGVSVSDRIRFARNVEHGRVAALVDIGLVNMLVPHGPQRGEKSDGASVKWGNDLQVDAVVEPAGNYGIVEVTFEYHCLHGNSFTKTGSVEFDGVLEDEMRDRADNHHREIARWINRIDAVVTSLTGMAAMLSSALDWNGSLLESFTIDAFGLPAETMENAIEFLSGLGNGSWGVIKGVWSEANEIVLDSNYRLAELLPEDRIHGERERQHAP